MSAGHDKSRAELLAEVESLRAEVKRLKAAQQLDPSLARYMADVMFVTDAKYRFTSLSPSIESVFGYRPEELVGRSIVEIVAPEFATKVQANMLKRQQAEDRGDYEYTNRFEAMFLQKDGKAVWVESLVNGMYDEQNQRLGLVGVCRDVTNRKKAEQALLESQRQYKLLADNMVDVVWTTDASYVVTYVSPSVTTTFGFDPGEIVGQTFFELMTPRSRKKALEALALRQKQEAVGNREFVNRIEGEFVHIKGHTLWMEGLSRAVYNEQGECTGYMGVSRDITKRKEAEMALTQSKSRFRRVIEDMQQVGITLDEEGRLIYANKYFLELTGWSAQEVLNKDYCDLFVPEAIRDEVRQVLHKAIAMDPNQHHSFNENEIVGRDGTVHVVGWTNVPTHSSLGDGVRLTCLGVDLTERRQVEERIKESEERFRSIVEGSPMGIYLYELNANDELILIGTNPAADRLTGIRNQELLGLPIEQAFTYLAQSEIPERFRKAARQGISWFAPRFYHNDEIITGYFDVYAFQTSPGRMAVMFMEVTSQVEAEQALRAEEARYRTLFENAAIGILLADQNFMVVDANNQACRSLGYNHKELCDMHAAELIHPEDLQRFSLQEVQIQVAQGGVLHYERRYLCRDGSYLPVEVHLRSVDAQTHLVMFLDISARLEAQKELKSFQQLMEAMTDNMIDMLWAKDLDGHYLFANPAMRNSLLKSDDIEVVGRTDLFFAQRQRDMGHAHTFGECCKDSDKDVLEGDQPGRFIEDGLVQGEFLALDVQKSPLYDLEGSLMGTVGTGRDITEQLRAQQALRRSEALLNETQRIGMIGGWEINLETDEVYWTDTEYRLFGLEPKSTHIDKNYIMNEVVHSSSRDQLRHAFEGLLQTRQPMEVEYTALVKGKGERLFVVIAAPEVDEGGKVRRIYGITRDITEERQAEEVMREAKEAAENASRTKSEFLANMSHELRTPLNGIFGMLQLAQMTELDEEQRGYLDTALSTGRSLLAIINDVLDFSKLEAGAMDIAPASFDLRRSLDIVVNSFQVQVREKGLNIVVLVDDDVPAMVVGDDARIRQIIFNLVGNAVKFCEQGEVRIEVSSVWPLPTGARLLFIISDTGIGIAEDQLDRVFDAFTQVDGAFTRRYKGTGLGLGIVRRLVRLMGGNMAVSSTQGQGTKVYVSLPFGMSTVTADRSDDVHQNHGISPLHVLLAEDEMVNQMAARLLLEKQGHKVTCASTGREAVQAANAGAFDCVLMDVQMPEMDGLEATAEIKKRNPGLPVIAMTAHAMRGDKKRFMDAGMDGYISKPIDLEALFRLLAGIEKRT